MVKPSRIQRTSLSGNEFLTDPSSDELSLIKMGAASDPHSMMVLYRSDGQDDAVRSPNPQLDGFLAVIVFQEMQEFTLHRNKKAIQIPRSIRGSTGLHDLRNTWSSAKYPVYSLNLVFSSAFLGELQPGAGYRGMDLLRDALDYGSPDDTLLHLGLSLVPAFKEPKANRLFIDQVFLAASTYLISKHRAQQPLVSVRGGLTPWQEKTTKEFLAANIQSNVSLADLANLCDLSPPQFARLFKRSTGTSPYRWFIERRLALSQLMLESSNDDLAGIALACGFADQSHFTRTFSRIVGLSPAAWRRLQRN
jgi:AraC family transcriptional regulator